MTRNLTLHSVMIRGNKFIKVFIMEAPNSWTSIHVRPVKCRRYNLRIKADEALVLYIPPHLRKQEDIQQALNMFLDAEESWVFKLLSKEKDSFEHLSYTQELLAIFSEEVGEIANRLKRQISSLHNVGIKLSKLEVHNPKNSSWNPDSRFTFAYVDTHSKEQIEREIIHISTDLINTPKYVLESVIYHELSHLAQFAQEGDTNHDENFYKFADLDPNKQKCSAWLRAHSTEVFPAPSDLAIMITDEGKTESVTNFVWDWKN